MRDDSIQRRRRVRGLLMGLGLLLFLPPLSLLPQCFGEVNFCGTWCPRMFLKLQPSVRLLGTTYMGVGLALAVVSVTLLFGRYWCSHLCPVGAAMELTAKLVPRWARLDFRRLHAPSVRYGYLAVFLLAPVLHLGALCCNLCNFVALPRLLAAPLDPASRAYLLTTLGGMNLVSLAALGVFARGGRAYCNFMCPLGALDSLVNALAGRLGARRVRVDPDRCNGCGACVAACPTWAVTVARGTARVSQFSCLPCGRCEAVCSRQAVGRRGRG